MKNRKTLSDAQYKEWFDYVLNEVTQLFVNDHLFWEVQDIIKKNPRLHRGGSFLHDKTITVSRCGRICDRGLKVRLSRAFAGQDVGIKEMEDGIWVVSFLDCDLGYFDNMSKRVEPVEDPFGFLKV